MPMRRYLLPLLFFLLWLDPANAASCFWVGGTATWNTVNTGGGGTGGIKWASTTGGSIACLAVSGPNAGVPGPSDTVTFDGSSGGGTVTVNFGSTITVQSITCGAFTGTLDFSTNNNSVTLSSGTGFSYTGAGTRTINMGSGTWTFTGVSSNLINGTTTTGLTLSSASALLVFTATTASSRGIRPASGATHASLTVSANTGGGTFSVSALSTAQTFTSVSAIGPNCIVLPNGVTTTITNAMSISGSSSGELLFISDITGNTATVSSANSHTFTWSAFRDLTFSGGGSPTATNSFDLGHNSGITITAPVVGGGGRVIGGWLLRRDLYPANDNDPMWLEKSA